MSVPISTRKPALRAVESGKHVASLGAGARSPGPQILDVVRAVSALHKAEIAHGDIKPVSVIFDYRIIFELHMHVGQCNRVQGPIRPPDGLRFILREGCLRVQIAHA